MSITKKVKIVATIGPASDSEEMIEKLALAGADVFRLNFSHKDWDYFGPLVNRIRRVEKKIGRPLAILGDIPGPKIRIGQVAEGTVVANGDKLKFVGRSVSGSHKIVSVNFPEVLHYLKKDTEIYLGDGAIKMEVEKVSRGEVIARVTGGGPLRSRMGFSAQGMTLSSFNLNVRDRLFIKKVIESDLDMIAISFVQSPRDVIRVKKLLPKKNRPILVAKIETDQAVKNAEDIIDECDAMMIARGDLGFSIPYPELPHVQKKLIKLCLRKSKPVITATQMLESMIYSHFPTRAEVSDVANAILDGTDAVMLSAETAIGDYPQEVVRTMAKVIQGASSRVALQEFYDQKTVADAVALSAVKIANQIGARLIIVFTTSGVTARRISRHRSSQWIIVLSPNPRTIRQLGFSWGITGKMGKITENIDQLISEAKTVARYNSIIPLSSGEPFIISAGVPFGKSGGTNLVLIGKA